MPTLVVTPVDQLIRGVVHQICARRPALVFLRPRSRWSVQAGEIHKYVTLSADQCLHELLTKELGEITALPVAVFDELSEKLLGAFVLPVERQSRLPAEQG